MTDSSPRGFAPGPFAVDWETRFDFDALRAGRVERAHHAMAEQGLDALLVWKYENVRYLTSLRSQVIAGKSSILNGVLLAAGSPPVLLASGGEVDKLVYSPWLTAIHAIPVMEQAELVSGFVSSVLKPLLHDLGLTSSRLGIDQSSMTLLAEMSLQLPSVALLDGDRAMQKARRIKLPVEIDLLDEACAIGDAVTQRALDEARAGRRECEIAGDAMQTLYYLGGEMPHVVTPFVASGEHMAPPHRFATDKLVRNGDICFIDIGAMWNGYFSDIGRATVVGRPSARQKEVYSAVHAALHAGIAAMQPGNTTGDVTAAVVGEASSRGFGDNLLSLFLGHGIGIGANEPPYIGETLPGATVDELEPGMVFALEPLIWVPDSGGVGVRIEDMIAVTEHGPRVLSRVPYDESLLS